MRSTRNSFFNKNQNRYEMAKARASIGKSSKHYKKHFANNPSLSPVVLPLTAEQSLLFALLISASLIPAVEAVQKQKNNPELLKQLDKKIVLDPEISATKELKQGCKVLTKVIKQTLPIIPAYVSNVLKEDIEIVCTSKKKFIKRIRSISDAFDSKGANIEGAFFPSHTEKNNKIYIPVTDLQQSGTTLEYSGATFKHELHHAADRFRHFVNCHLHNTATVSVPFFPVEPVVMSQYKNAIDKGEDRIEEFRKLIQKRNAKMLSSYEAKKLKKIMEVIREGVLPAATIIQVSEERYNYLMQSEKAKKDEYTDTNEYGECKFVKTLPVKQKGKYEAVFYIKNPEYVVFYALDTAKLSLPAYNRFPPAAQLLERVTWASQYFSHETLELFYPELMKLLADFVKRCPLPSEEKASAASPRLSRSRDEL